MFFRIKEIKGKEYAYYVKNQWKNNRSKQKVVDYLGRIYRFELKSNIDFLSFKKIYKLESYLNDNTLNQIIHDLLEWELFRFGIDKRDFVIDLENLKVQKNNRDITLLINEGYMCKLTLKNLLEFKAEGDEDNDGYRLAKVFVEAGIKVPQEIFVGIFQKLNPF